MSFDNNTVLNLQIKDVQTQQYQIWYILSLEHETRIKIKVYSKYVIYACMWNHGC